MKAIMNSIYDKTLLLIDNDTTFLNILSDLLKNEGFQTILTAGDCKTALDIINEYDDVYIITEFNFKSMKGEALIRKLKKRLNGGMRVIVLSNTTKDSDAFKTFSLGALSFIHKTEPEWDTILKDSLRTWISHYNQQQIIRKEFISNTAYAQTI